MIFVLNKIDKTTRTYKWTHQYTKKNNILLKSTNLHKKENRLYTQLLRPKQ